MTATRKLFVNWLTKLLQVSDSNGGVVTLPEFNKYENVPFEIVIVEPDTSAIGPPRWARIDISNLSLGVAINDTYDDASPLAYQNTFTKDEESNTFTGSLNLNTAALNAWLGSSDSKTGYFEVELQESSDNTSKIYQVAVLVKNSVLQVGATVPSPTDEYYTKAQADQQFVKPVGVAGAQITLTSPGNIYQRILGVTDDGQPIDQIIAVL